jgi:drug/metabolite transporter, DME family
MARSRIFAAALLFGTTGTAQAVAHAGSAIGVGAGRIVLGGALLALVAQLRRELVALRRDLALVIVSALGVGTYQLAFFAAVRSAGVAVGTVVTIGAGAVFTGMIERFVERDSAGARWAVATTFAVAGLAVLAIGSQRGGSMRPAGIVLALVAALAYASYAVVSKRLLRLGHSAAGVMGASFGAAGLLLLPVLVAAGGAWLATARGAALIVYLAAIPTAAAYLLYAAGLRSVTAAETTTIGLAEPLTAAMLAVVVLHERLHTAGLVGAGLILVGLVLLAAPLPRRPLRALPSGT